jgi:hypothetical protein
MAKIPRREGFAGSAAERNERVGGGFEEGTRREGGEISPMSRKVSIRYQETFRDSIECPDWVVLGILA